MTRPELELIDLRRIWDHGEHNAFTDLVRFRDAWFCTCREASGHAVTDGNVRVFRSVDGEAWESAAFIECPKTHTDLRDPKLSVTPAGELMLTTAAYKPVCQPFVWFSTDGASWGDPHAVGDPGTWLWRPIWHKGRACGFAYDVGRNGATGNFVQLYASETGRDFSRVGPRQLEGIYANETAMAFLEDDACVCLLRCDGDDSSAKVGRAEPPYRDWRWRDLGVQIGGPALLRLPDGQFLAAVRLQNGGARTSLCWLDPAAATLTEALRLPSGGDTSYAGMALHEGLVWVAYYSSHEGKTSIYLAKVRAAA